MLQSPLEAAQLNRDLTSQNHRRAYPNSLAPQIENPGAGATYVENEKHEKAVSEADKRGAKDYDPKLLDSAIPKNNLGIKKTSWN